VISSDLVSRAINTIRFLSAGAVQKANSGHPGLPMGRAAMATSCGRDTCASTRKEPRWPDRDRFVLSAGHGSMLLYSLLHLTGFDTPARTLSSSANGKASPPAIRVRRYPWGGDH
jgi:transketolase